MTQKYLYVVDHYVPFPASEYGGIWNVIAENDEECLNTCDVTRKDNKLHGDDGKERMTNINGKLQPANFPVTGTDQIGRDRMLKINALNTKNAASQQANGQTNNGGGLSF